MACCGRDYRKRRGGGGGACSQTYEYVYVRLARTNISVCSFTHMWDAVGIIDINTYEDAKIGVENSYKNCTESWGTRGGETKLYGE